MENTFLAGDLNDVDFKIDRLFKEGGDNVYGLGVTLEGLDVNPLMYEFVLNMHGKIQYLPTSGLQIGPNAEGGM